MGSNFLAVDGEGVESERGREGWGEQTRGKLTKNQLKSKLYCAQTSATTPTQPAITAAFAWAPLMPPSPDVTNTFEQ